MRNNRTRFWFDTEFIDNTKSLELISIGIVTDGNKSYYAVSNEFVPEDADDWVKANIFPQLPHPSNWKSRDQIKHEILQFIGKCRPEFWVYNGAYDWIAFCRLFGNIRDLPAGFPWYANDIKQLWYMLGSPPLPKQETGKHHALEDAKWVKTAWEYLINHPNIFPYYKNLR